MKKTSLIVLFFCIMAASFLSGCATKEPSIRDLKEMVPSEVLSYQYGEDTYTSTVSSLEIVRARTYEEVYTADCVIELTDDICDRTAYITISSIHWDKGGWQLENWNSYQQEEMELRIPFDKEFLENKFTELGYHFENFTETNFLEQDNGVVSASYSVQDEHENLTAFGELTSSCVLTSEEGYPAKYFWEIETDESGISCSWDIFGLWSAANLPPFYEGYGTIELFLSDISDEQFWTDLRIPFYSFTGKVNRHSSVGKLIYEGAFSFDNLSGNIGNYYNSTSTLLERNLTLTVYTDNDSYSRSEVDMQFFADSAYCAYISGLNMGMRKNCGWVDLEKIS